MRRRAMGKPILPSPINPMSMRFPQSVGWAKARSDVPILHQRTRNGGHAIDRAFARPMALPTLRLLHLGEYFARNAKTVDAGRDAGVAGDLHEDLADLVLAHPVDQRALDMHAQLVRPVQDRDHGEVEHAAGFPRQLFAAPDRAPAI